MRAGSRKALNCAARSSCWDNSFAIAPMMAQALEFMKAQADRPAPITTGLRGDGSEGSPWPTLSATWPVPMRVAPTATLTATATVAQTAASRSD